MWYRWKTLRRSNADDENYGDGKVLGLLVDDPKLMTRAQVESQVDDGLAEGMLVHVFASCGATLAKTPFAFDATRDWIDSDDVVRRRCGYALL